MNKNSISSDIKFMMILSLICSFLLGGTHYLMGNRAELDEKTINSIFAILGSTVEKENLYDTFTKDFQQLSKGRIKLWRYLKNESIIACEATGSGMWSEVTIVFVTDTNKNQILGLKVTEQKETAGLGSRIEDEDFCNQFTDKKIGFNTKVDAITGATISSESVGKLLNKALNIINLIN